MKLPGPQLTRVLEAVLLANLLCIVLLGIRFVATGSLRYSFIPLNLLLAWVAFGLAWFLVMRVKDTPWLRWDNILISLLWLGFLPNTWYVLTDYIHIRATGELSQIFDIVLMSLLVVSGFTLGFTSLYLVHQQLLKRLEPKAAGVFVGAILLLSSFAIYLGRDLRWNTWDVLANPADLILDVSDRIGDPLGHPRSFTMTSLFFVLLVTLYIAIFRVVSSLRSTK